MNRIGSVVELKFYIRVQEEDIRMQEEFVLYYGLLSPITRISYELFVI